MKFRPLRSFLLFATLVVSLGSFAGDCNKLIAPSLSDQSLDLLARNLASASDAQYHEVPARFSSLLGWGRLNKFAEIFGQYADYLDYKIEINHDCAGNGETCCPHDVVSYHNGCFIDHATNPKHPGSSKSLIFSFHRKGQVDRTFNVAFRVCNVTGNCAETTKTTLEELIKTYHKKPISFSFLYNM